MRTIIAVLCVAIGMFVGASLRPAAAQPQQEEWLPFRSGATVKLFTELSQTTIVCKVQQVTDGFIGCFGNSQQPARWINLRVVKEVTPHQ
jgi:hypothetical protein